MLLRIGRVTVTCALMLTFLDPLFIDQIQSRQAVGSSQWFLYCPVGHRDELVAGDLRAYENICCWVFRFLYSSIGGSGQARPGIRQDLLFPRGHK